MSSQTSLGDVRQRMLTLWQEARLAGINLNEVIPDEMLVHFAKTVELKAAREYISELEQREKQLEQDKEDLTKALEAEKKKVEDIPADFKQLQVDFEQQVRKTTFYQNLSKSEEKRAEDYKAQYDTARKQATSAFESAKQIEALQKECAEYQISIIKHVEENVTLRDACATLQNKVDSNMCLVADEKDEQIRTLQRDLANCELHYQALEEEKDEFEMHYQSLVETIDAEMGHTGAKTNALSYSASKDKLLKNAALSELRPLNKFWKQSHLVVAQYQCIFRQLAVGSGKLVFAPQAVKAGIANAAAELEAVDEVHKLVQLEAENGDDVRLELSDMASRAKEHLDVLLTIAMDVDTFSHALAKNPGLWSSIKSKFKRRS